MQNNQVINNVIEEIGPQDRIANRSVRGVRLRNQHPRPQERQDVDGRQIENNLDQQNEILNDIPFDQDDNDDDVNHQVPIQANEEPCVSLPSYDIEPVVIHCPSNIETERMNVGEDEIEQNYEFLEKEPQEHDDNI